MQLNLILQVCGDIFEVTMGTLLGAYGKAMKWQEACHLSYLCCLEPHPLGFDPLEAVNLGRAPSLVAFNVTLAIFTT